MVRLCCTSDCHSHLPPISECDICLLGGDIIPDGNPILQSIWLDTKFRRWLDEIPAKHVVGVSGNHDRIFQDAPHLVPKDLRWHYLEDQMIELEGLKIYGTPWIKPIWGAFQRDELGLAEVYAKIPHGLDIVISHGPCFGIRDLVPLLFDEHRCPEGENCGSQSLRTKIFEVLPKFFIHGHIHNQYGMHEESGITFINCALVNDAMVPSHEPILFDLK